MMMKTHEDIIVVIIIDSEEDKDLVSYETFQNYEFDDECLDDLKRLDLEDKPLEDEEIASVYASYCDKEHGSEDDDVNTYFGD